MSDEKIASYEEIATSLLDLGDAKTVLSAFLHHTHADAFDPEYYSHIATQASSRDNISGEQRLFIAKGKIDGMAPGSLIKFIENDVGMNIGDVGKIDILEKFSYMNVKAAEAEVILSFYKTQNRRKPLVVQAKGRDGDGG